ncbi:MAG: hypothetical protein GVY35_16420 [Bacteroidetes bacterium]|nr:hypothetical protein [Bacteroidota bacterium]
MKRAILLGVVGAVLAGMSTALDAAPSAAAGGPAPLVPVLSSHVADRLPADTVRHRVTAGEPLIVTLPDALSNGPVTAYRPLRAPALSWLVDRSLLWRTRAADAGTHTLLIRASFEAAPPDTLTILVDVIP